MTFDEFINSYRNLKATLPLNATHSLNNSDSELSDYTYNSESCTYSFDCRDCQNCIYCFECVSCKECVDCDYCLNCDASYNLTDCAKVYNSVSLEYCSRTYDSYYSWDCADCHDIFGCVHLRQQQYCIFNKQYSKEEYYNEIIKLKDITSSEIRARIQKLILKHPFGPTNIVNSEQCEYGNHIYNSLKLFLSFDTSNSQNSGYLYDSSECKDCYDLSHCHKAELCYDCVDSAEIFNCDYLEWCSNCFGSSYLFACTDCHNCWGCVNLKHKKFCVLNKQYSEEEYNKLIEQITRSAQ